MPELADAQAFFQPGLSEIVSMTTVADTAGLQATAAELLAGLKLCNEMYDVNGFSASTNWIERRRAKVRTRTQLAGAVVFEGSSIIFTGDKLGNDAAAQFNEGDVRTLFFADRGLVAGRPAEAFVCEVGAVVNLRNYDSDYFRVRIDFGIQKRAKVVVPAGV